MTIQRLICCFGLILAVQSVPAIASEPSRIYQYYLDEGIKAFESHNDEEASRYFAWAHEIDPAASAPQEYATALSKRQRFEGQAADNTGVYFPYFEEMLTKGKDALNRKDYVAAKQFFYTAHLLDRDHPQPLEYLNLVKRLSEGRVVTVDRPKVVLDTLDKGQKTVPAPKAVALVDKKPMALPDKPLSSSKGEKLPVPLRQIKLQEKRIDILTLDEILAQAQGGRALVRIDLGSSLIVEGKNIQKFLVITENPVVVKAITRDQIQIDARKIGVTFIHIWDDLGRRTIYVEVVFPKPPEGEAVAKVADLDHSRAFRLHYANDWSSYYSGTDMFGVKRKSLGFQQSMGVDGETPYGFFDASGTTFGTDKLIKLVSYTTGLSGIPVPGTNDLNVRFFDATRNLTPLTLPGSSLRGAFVDVNIFKDIVGLSASHGRAMGSFGYFSQGTNTSSGSYIDAGRVLFFPKDMNKHYSFNYARGTGNRSSDLTKDVYSIEGAQKFGRVTLNAELAQDDKTNAGLAGMRWDNGDFHSALNVRNTGKEFTTVTGASAGQGVSGATWTTDSMIRKASVSTALDVYQDHINYNPDNPDGINYSVRGQVSVPLDEKYIVDLGSNYLDSPGDLSPRTYLSGTARLTRALDFWMLRQGSAYVGSSYQRSRFAFVPTAEYDRYGAFTGLYIPLTRDLSFNGNYEYSWLSEPLSGNDYHPSVLTTGLAYSRQITNKLSGNMGINYRQESGYGGTNSFLAGEDSLGFSAGLSYNPARDVTIFMDSRLNNAWGKTSNNVSYNDMDLRWGLRSTWGSSVYWDPVGTVEGIVFKDKNGNGKFDKGEEGISKVKVKVGDKEAVTDGRGWYHMTLRAKKVVVAVAADTVPPGFVFSTPTFTKVMLRQGLRDRVNFGLTTRSGIYGVVFVDKNGNGAPDEGDHFMDRVKVMVDGKVVQVSDAQGAYFFTNVPPGKHTISLDMGTLPVKFIPLIKMRNEIDLAEGTTYVFHIQMKLKE